MLILPLHLGWGYYKKVVETIRDGNWARDWIATRSKRELYSWDILIGDQCDAEIM